MRDCIMIFESSSAVESRAWREAEHLFTVPSTTDSTSSEAWRKVFQVSGGLPGPGRPSPFMVFCQERLSAATLLCC